MTQLIHELIAHSAQTHAQRPALQEGKTVLDYASLNATVTQVAQFYLNHGLERFERVAVWLEKRIDTVTALFGAAAAGGVFVPVNPLLKPEQVGHILTDCNVRILVTSPERLELLRETLAHCRDLRTVILTGDKAAAPLEGVQILRWTDGNATPAAVPSASPHRVIDQDMAAILYTSGSTGKPKGVVLSHRNLVAGAESVSQYLQNTPEDRILSVLPLSFDYGLSQLTTAFRVGACAVLMNYLLPRDVIRAVEREKITGLAAVPPLWVQLAQLDWPESISEHLRYITNSGGHMPKPTLDALRARSPKTMPYLMYGLTEAFRSTYLPPDQIDIRPDSMGKAIPNAEILVVHEDGTPCAPGEPGELVHRGVHVALGYWNDPEKTAERYKPAPGQLGGLVIPELAVWSGDPRSKSLIVRGQAQLLQNVTVGQDIERVRRLFEALETQSTFMRLLDATHTAEGVQIFIGAENQLFELSGCSLIVAPFRNMRSEVVGAIGVVGPSRVNYGKVIPMVDYTAKVMTRLLFPS